MPDEHGLEDVLEEASAIRHHLNEELWVDYRKQQKLFNSLFGAPGSDLKLLVDMIHYQGGYPSPKSPPRHESMGRRFGEAFRLLWLVGRHGDLNQHLEKFGLKVVVTDPKKLALPLQSKRIPPKFEEWLQKNKRRPPKEWTTKSVLLWFIRYCDKLQTEICGKANIIKHQLYPEAAKKAGEKLSKADFRETVGLKYRANLVNDHHQDGPVSEKELRSTKRKKVSTKRRTAIIKRLHANQDRIGAFQVGLKVATKGIVKKEHS